MRTLSITINDDLYNSLKHTVPARKISKFVSEALVEKLAQKREKLYKAYLEASQDEDREADLHVWDHLSVESWEGDEEDSTNSKKDH